MFSVRKKEYTNFIKQLKNVYNDGSKRYDYPITIDNNYNPQKFRDTNHLSKFILNNSIPMDLFGKGKYKNTLKPEV